MAIYKWRRALGKPNMAKLCPWIFKLRSLENKFLLEKKKKNHRNTVCGISFVLFCYGSLNKIIQLYSILINLNLTQYYNKFYKILNSRVSFFFHCLVSTMSSVPCVTYVWLSFSNRASNIILKVLWVPSPQLWSLWSLLLVSTIARDLFANTIKFVPNIFAACHSWHLSSYPQLNPLPSCILLSLGTMDIRHV